MKPIGTDGIDYEQLKAETNCGWNTMSMLSYVHLPHGFAINLCLKEFSSDKVLRDFFIWESTGEDHGGVLPVYQKNSVLLTA
jgi:hypothetical protein